MTDPFAKPPSKCLGLLSPVLCLMLVSSAPRLEWLEFCRQRTNTSDAEWDKGKTLKIALCTDTPSVASKLTLQLPSSAKAFLC